MKKILILTFLFFNLVSCEKIENLTDFSLHYDTDFVIPANIPVNTLVHLEETDFSISSEDFENNNTSKDLLEKVVLEKITLTLNNSGDNFDFLTDIEIYIQAEDLPKVRMAWKNNIPDGLGNTLILETLNEDILSYFKKDTISVFVDLKADQSVDHEMPATATFDFKVNAKILGN